MIEAAVAAGRPLLVAVAVGAGLLTLLSMLKIWNEAFWSEAPESPVPESRRPTWTMVLPMVALALGTLGIGLFAEPFVLPER